MAGFRPTRRQIAMGAMALVGIVGTPILAAAGLERWEPRTLGWLGLAIGAVTIGLRSLWGRPSAATLAIQYGPGIALLAAVVVSNDRLGLLLLPALVNLYLAVGTGWTLTTERSLVERVGAFIQPHMPEFTRSYCHKVTVLWTLFFAANVLGIAWLALAREQSEWLLYSSRLYFVVVALLTAFEFCFRKIYFRHYSSGPMDKVFAAFFPAENTERGRRSAAYLQKMRDLGLKTD